MVSVLQYSFGSLRYCILKNLQTMSKNVKARYFTTASEKRLRVLLDMDQVLADFEGQFLVNFRQKYPDEPFIPLSERKGFWIRNQYEKLKPDLMPKVCDVYNAKGFFLSLPEVEGAVAAARELAAMEGVDVFVCTSPVQMYKHCLREKYQWVEKHLGLEWVDKVILTKDKTMANGHLLIDDRPNISGACDPPPWEHVVFTTCHNGRTDIRGKRRLDNWTDGTWRDIIQEFKKRI